MSWNIDLIDKQFSSNLCVNQTWSGGNQNQSCVNFIQLYANAKILAFSTCITKRSGVPFYFSVLIMGPTFLVQSGMVNFWVGLSWKT